MSRNEDRLGLGTNPNPDQAPVPAVATPGGPAFSWSVPTEFVELPSQGIFYPAGHPLAGQKTVEIRYMTAKEEDILTSRSLLKEGVALDRMLQNIIVNQDIDITSLLVGDKNALLVAARRTGYGPEYQTKVTCPACDSVEEYSFDISEPPCNDFRKEAEDNGVNFTSDGLFTIRLPMSNVEVVCRLLTSEDEGRLLKEAQRKDKRKQASASSTDAFRSYIVSVNGDDSIFTIESFVQSMPARDARHLRNVYAAIVPNIVLNQNFECLNCGYEADMEVPLGLDFFWPG